MERTTRLDIDNVARADWKLCKLLRDGKGSYMGLKGRLARASLFPLGFYTRLSCNSDHSTRERPETGSLDITFDIAFCILKQAENFSMLRNLILINSIFFNAYTTYRLTTIRTVILNMYGEALLDYFLVLAATIDNRRACITSIGEEKALKILLEATDRSRLWSSQSVVKLLPFISGVVDTWVDLFASRDRWMGPIPDGAPRVGCVSICPDPTGSTCAGMTHSRDDLSDSEKFRFRRALLLYWCYCACTGPSVKEYDFHIGKLDHIFDYFSGFELAEMASVSKFFDKLLRTAGEECCTDKNWRSTNWRYYYEGRSPYWFLKLLNDRDKAFEEEAGIIDGRQDGGAMRENYLHSAYLARNCSFVVVPMDLLTDDAHEELVKFWKEEEVDGNFRVLDGRGTT